MGPPTRSLGSWRSRWEQMVGNIFLQNIVHVTWYYMLSCVLARCKDLNNLHMMKTAYILKSICQFALIINIIYIYIIYTYICFLLFSSFSISPRARDALMKQQVQITLNSLLRRMGRMGWWSSQTTEVRWMSWADGYHGNRMDYVTTRNKPSMCLFAFLVLQFVQLPEDVFLFSSMVHLLMNRLRMHLVKF